MSAPGVGSGNGASAPRGYGCTLCPDQVLLLHVQEMHDGGRAQATVPEWQPKGVGVCQVICLGTLQGSMLQIRILCKWFLCQCCSTSVASVSKEHGSTSSAQMLLQL